MALTRLPGSRATILALGIAIVGSTSGCSRSDSAAANAEVNLEVSSLGNEVDPDDIEITGIAFDDASARTEAVGSDNWPITWAENGNLYTSFGDGNGFGSGGPARVSLGIARIEGGKDDYRGVNIAGGIAARHRSPFDGKSEGILAIGNTLYLWRNGNGSGTAAFDFARLYRSTDLGATWTHVGVEFSKNEGDFVGRDEGFFSPAFAQFGKGYTGSHGNYVYVYAPEINARTHWDLQKPGRIALLRVPVRDIENKSAYEFYAGPAGGGATPQWTSDVSQRIAVWQHPDGTHRMAVSYNAPLGRYLLTTMTVDRKGHISIYDAPAPWGPWHHLHTERNEARWGSKAILFSFVNKWLSADGRDFVIVHTKNDSWSTIEGSFTASKRAP